MRPSPAAENTNPPVPAAAVLSTTELAVTESGWNETTAPPKVTPEMTPPDAWFPLIVDVSMAVRFVPPPRLAATTALPMAASLPLTVERRSVSLVVAAPLDPE
jgi:hypothetical protein